MTIKRIEDLAKKYTSKVDNRNKAEFYRRAEEKIGISREELEATEGLTSQINAYRLETMQWIKKMRDDTCNSGPARHSGKWQREKDYRRF